MNHHRTRSFSNISSYSFMSDKKNMIQEMEKDTNKICWLYDSVMPILQISQYLPSIQRWQSQLKSIDQRIIHKEKQLKECSQKIDKYKKKQPNLNQSKKNELQFQYETCFKMLLELQAQVNTFSKSHRPIQIQKSQMNFEMNLFEKQIEGKVSKTKNSIDKILMQSKPKLFCIQNKCKQPYQQLMIKIQQLKAQIPQNNLVDFHKFNCKRLQGQIQSINQRLENIFYMLVKKYSLSMQFITTESQEISEEIQDIQWQLKGMAKKYLRQIDFAFVCPELSASFAQEQRDEFFIKTLQKQISVDIQNLEQKINQTKKKSIQLLKILQDPSFQQTTL